MQVLPSVFVGPSDLGGRGVFTAADIPAGSLIEISPVIVLSETDTGRIHKTKLHDYYFVWGKNDDQSAIILGYGSIYNHSFEPNAQYAPDFDGKTLQFYAIDKIEAGDEITVNYNGDPSVQRKLWFKDNGLAAEG
ncbi:MAG: SET domain-containing protein [Saprospiraceae bacterium]|nr:SET domain-containing protein [Saprospiraceae bacterium]